MLPVTKCNGKVCYDKKGAMTAKNKRWEEDHIALRIYQCEGSHWHLTSLNPYKRDKKPKFI